MVWLSLVFLCVGVLAFSALIAGGVLQHLPRWKLGHGQHWRAVLSEFFLFIDPARLWGSVVGLCVLVAGLVFVGSGNLLLTALAAFGVALLPRWMLSRWRRKRLQRCDEQLPDALLTLAAALRAGASLPNAMQYLARDAMPPLSQEFALVLREQRLGIAMDQALLGVSVRVPTEAVVLSVAALRIAVETGGNLAEALERVAVMIRTRLQVYGRIDALTAQGRMQAWVMGVLPLFLLLVLSYLEPLLMAGLWQTETGWMVLGTVVVLEVVGILWIRRIVAIDV